MGGAFTALDDDPAACSFYNPATIARMRGHSLSATGNLYNKYDVKVGRDNSAEAPLRVNQGSFRPISAAAGSIGAFGNFAVGLNIVMPDYEYYSGEIDRSQVGNQTNNTILQLQDDSLWVGGNIALNLDEDRAAGLTVYYTARSYQRTTIDQSSTPTTLRSILEEKTFTHNSLIYMLGYYQKLNTNWSLGTSLRFPSLAVSGRGSYFRSVIDTTGSPPATTESRENVPAETRIPLRAAIGLAYSRPKISTYSLDIVYHAPETYRDFEGTSVSDIYVYRPMINVAIGAEYFLEEWARLRLGVFTNYASTQPIPDVQNRYTDNINMMGFSANLAIIRSDKISFTFGGYYTGGTGDSIQLINQQLVKKSKSKQIFSMLIGTAYRF